jgi:hypothetical protein
VAIEIAIPIDNHRSTIAQGIHDCLLGLSQGRRLSSAKVFLGRNITETSGDKRESMVFIIG